MTMPVGTTAEEKAAIKEWLKDRSKHLTGFCNENGKPGQHEGTKPKSSSGRPMPTCSFHTSCPCKCHYEIDKMYAIAGIERVEPVDNPEYVPDLGHFVMPDPKVRFDIGGPSNDDVGNDTPIVEGIGVAPPVAPTAGVAPTALPPTPSGRRHRGQLEYEVLSVCQYFVTNPEAPKLCSPKWVAEEIADTYKIPTPSTGAIQAVWDRWVKIGIASYAKKPVRFLGWTGDFDGTPESLERIKASKKRQEKSAKSAAARGHR